MKDLIIEILSIYLKWLIELWKKTTKYSTIVIMGSYGRNNVGDDAILLSTLEMLKKRKYNLKIIVFKPYSL